MTEVSLTGYADELFGGEDELLRQMRVEAVEEGLPSIQVPTDLGRLLAVLITQLRARSVLEMGTLFGYSAILMARAMPEDGRLTTLEVDPKHAAVARGNFERAGIGDRISILEGPALESLDTLRGRTFDLVFIDANKDGYPDYLARAVELTRRGSIIVADNVWRKGSVINPPYGDSGTQAIARFNRLLASEPRLVSTLFPTRDGADAASVSVVR